MEGTVYSWALQTAPLGGRGPMQRGDTFSELPAPPFPSDLDLTLPPAVSPHFSLLLSLPRLELEPMFSVAISAPGGPSLWLWKHKGLIT